MVSRLLRSEGLAVFAAALIVYFEAGYGWVLLVALALAPDISIAGYLGGPRIGAFAYDAAHTYVLALALAAAGILAGSDLAVQLALIWLAHIGADRFLGYGLKYATHFKETHLQRV
jgi:hypothetical protein